MNYTIRRIFFGILCILLCCICTSCEFGIQEAFYRKDGVDKRVTALADITPPEIHAANGVYSFVILTDLHFGKSKAHRGEDLFFQSIQNSSEKPQFVIVLGDIADHGKSGEFAEFIRFIKRLPDTIPYYGIPGNHDLYNSGWSSYKNTIAPYSSFYRFKTSIMSADGEKKRSWYFLDTANGTLGVTQFNILQKVMQEDSDKKFVFSHYGMHGGSDVYYFVLSNTLERISLTDLYAKNNVQAFFAGHWHPGSYLDYGKFDEFILHSFSALESRESHWFFVTVDETNATMKITTYRSAKNAADYTESVKIYTL